MLSASRESDLRRWLTSLGTLVAANLTLEDARARVSAYTSLLAPVSGALTEDSLDRAGRKFKWFPSYAEIAEFLDGEKAEIEKQLSRAKQIASSELSLPSKSQPRMSKFMEQLKAEDPEKFARMFPECAE